MRIIREILRLALVSKLSQRQIAKSCDVDHKTVRRYLERIPTEYADYGLIEVLDDTELAHVLGLNKKQASTGGRPLPDWSQVHHELKKKGVTRDLLWREYKEAHPDGYSLTQFKVRYRRWVGKVHPSMRQTHLAGEKLFVDYAGHTAPIFDPKTGKIRQAQIFVAVLGASSYTFAHASWDQSLPNWLRSHVKAFEYLGGVPKILVPDNLKSGVTKACRYDPDLNPAYHDLSVHYQSAVIPARVRRPQDKAKVEKGVQVVERWILAALRHHKFFSLEELNQKIRALLVQVNDRQMRSFGKSRRQLFEELDRPALQALPQEPYVFAQWKKAKVNIDYHVELDRHWYSVPYPLVRQEVQIRYTDQTIEIFHDHQRVASHRRNPLAGRHTTLRQHMPSNHQQQADWTPQRLEQWALLIGESTHLVVKGVMERKTFVEQGFRACLGIIRLGKRYGNDRLERACKRALAFGDYRYKGIEAILKKGLDAQVPAETEPDNLPQDHPNLRGQNYYN